jgi:hypothetical protein
MLEDTKMTPRMAAIFGTSPSESTVVALVVTSSRKPDAAPDSAAVEPWPIFEGTAHFSIWVDDSDGDWPEFVPGYHYDVRQPSRLRCLLTRNPIHENIR